MAPTIEDRFPTGPTSTPPSEATKAHIVSMRARVVELAEYIDATVVDGRDKSIALTSLEDVLFRANRAIYAQGATLAGRVAARAEARSIAGDGQ